MSQFKSKEEYEKWKIEKKKGQQEKSVDPIKEGKQSATMKNSNPNVGETSSKKRVYIFLAIGLIILVPAVIFSWYYMTHGKLSGNVYVTMKSGDVKKAAGIDIYALKDAQRVLSEIEKIKHDSEIALDEVNKEEADIYKAFIFNKIDIILGLAKEYPVGSTSDDVLLNRSQCDLSILEAKEYAFKYCSMILPESKTLAPFRTKVAELRTKKNNVKKEHDKNISTLLFSGKENKVQTDVDGFYSFQGLKYGKYLLFARYEVFDNKITWLTVAEIKERENKLDLTTNNSTGEIFFGED